MANIQDLKAKINMYNNFRKIIQIDKINIFQQISDLKNQIFGSVILANSINDLRKMVNERSKEFLPYTEKGAYEFSDSKRKAFFVLETKNSSQVGKYSDKKMVEFIEKNVDPERDVVYVIGERLFNFAQEKFKEKKQSMEHILFFDVNDGDYVRITKKIATGSLSLYKTLSFHNSVVVYDDIKNSSNMFQRNIFPLKIGDSDFKSDDKQVEGTYFEGIKEIMEEFGKNSTKYSADATVVRTAILKSYVMAITQYVITNYLLNLAYRDLQTLEDREKSIETGIQDATLLANKIRKESITRELLTNATAFKQLSKAKLIEAETISRKKVEDE